MNSLIFITLPLIIPALPAIFSLLGKTAVSYALWEGMDMAYKKLMGKGENNNIDGTIWKIGDVAFVPLSVMTIKDKSNPAYCILTMSKERINGKRLYRTYMVGTGESIILSSYDADLTGTFLKMGGPWTNMKFPDARSIMQFTNEKGFDNLIAWI